VTDLQLTALGIVIACFGSGLYAAGLAVLALIRQYGPRSELRQAGRPRRRAETRTRGLFAVNRSRQP
jgi:hypothetical protein